MCARYNAGSRHAPSQQQYSWMFHKEAREDTEAESRPRNCASTMVAHVVDGTAWGPPHLPSEAQKQRVVPNDLRLQRPVTNGATCKHERRTSGGDIPEPNTGDRTLVPHTAVHPLPYRISIAASKQARMLPAAPMVRVNVGTRDVFNRIICSSIPAFTSARLMSAPALATTAGTQHSFHSHQQFLMGREQGSFLKKKHRVVDNSGFTSTADPQCNQQNMHSNNKHHLPAAGMRDTLERSETEAPQKETHHRMPQQ